MRTAAKLFRDFPLLGSQSHNTVKVEAWSTDYQILIANGSTTALKIMTDQLCVLLRNKTVLTISSVGLP
jgi:hypothetical protein